MTAERPVRYLVTCAGLPNFGDELIAATWLRHLAAAQPDADVVVDCIKPKVAAAHLRDLHPRVRFTNTLWRLVGRQFAAGPREAVAAVKQDALRLAGLTPEGTARGDARLLAAADTVHLVGGGYINRLWPQVLGLLSAVTAISDRTRARAVMTGQCLWPPADGCADLVSALACQFNVADVRDEASASLISAASPSITGDDAFLGTALRPQAGPQPPPRVMVCLQSHLASMPIQRLVAFVAHTLAAWHVTEVGLLECAPGWDDEALRLAAAQLPVSVRYSLPQVLAGGFPADSGQAWISTRFHPHLVAAAMGASGVAVSVERDYYTTKHGSLIAGGSGWELVDDLSAAPAFPSGGGYSPQRLAVLKSGKRRLADRIYPPAGAAPDGRAAAVEPTAAPAT